MQDRHTNTSRSQSPHPRSSPLKQELHQQLPIASFGADPGHNLVLDGDIIRNLFSNNLGFTAADREENIRRIGFLAELLSRNGIIVIVSAISPYRAAREEVRTRIGNFLEVYVNAPLDVCEQRDQKGLYKRARRGGVKHFTGIDDPYEPPLSPDVECRTDQEQVKASCDRVLSAVLAYLSQPAPSSLQSPRRSSISPGPPECRTQDLRDP